MKKLMDQETTFTRVKNDINGNGRLVCHYLAIADTYEEAVKIANKVGGRKYHNKQYGGGLVFQAYSGKEIIDAINSL
jgi:hypothetical protein